MKRIVAVLLLVLAMATLLVLVGCDDDEVDAQSGSSSSSEFVYNGGILDIDPEDGTFGVDFGDIFGSGIELPDDEFE